MHILTQKFFEKKKNFLSREKEYVSGRIFVKKNRPSSKRLSNGRLYLPKVYKNDDKNQQIMLSNNNDRNLNNTVRVLIKKNMRVNICDRQRRQRRQTI